MPPRTKNATEVSHVTNLAGFEREVKNEWMGEENSVSIAVLA